ncbi:hypothetical protein FisN_9Hh262 [Fistulifera solaris]|uniref:Uncharacterized protein n=1 Tax=Fistulifera solaris TaxID=1519565 RepID=A0A1Z5JBH4_FISSO|nr:hypothetical protein FisN_9Hh262 [Fistulifera solaris]|eukprot:GAX11168.1 hypothetical protein FisN_9Hh262 [Fistulifera solaris]
MTELSPTSPTRQPRSSLGNQARNLLRIPTSRLASPKGPPILVELFLNQGIITLPSIIASTRVFFSKRWSGWGVKAANRRVCVCHDYGYDLPTACQEAVERILLLTAGVEAVSFQNTWWTVPAAVPAISDALLVAVTMTGVHCYAYAAGDVLPFTFQSCTTNQHYTAQTPAAEWQQQLQQWLTSRENNLITAMLACLQACPRAARSAVVHNIWLVGYGIVDVPRYSHMVAKTLKLRLEGHSPTVSQDSNPAVENDDSTPQSTQFPIGIKELQPLAPHVSALMVDSSDLTWLGASRWAHRLHGVDPDAKSFQWKFASPSDPARKD